jgi:hypothetical protein
VTSPGSLDPAIEGVLYPGKQTREMPEPSICSPLVPAVASRQDLAQALAQLFGPASIDPDDWDDAEADSVADLEAMWDATPAAVTVLSAPAGAASRAPA